VSSFQVIVTKNGKELFRTEEQPCGDGSNFMHQLGASEIAERFPAVEGFKVEMVIWPDKRGQLMDITVVDAKDSASLVTRAANQENTQLALDAANEEIARLKDHINHIRRTHPGIGA
jgi:hypothetical protein